LFATLRKMFNWALERGDMVISPLSGMRGPPAPKSRDRVLADEEVAAVWAAAGSIGWPFGPMVQLLLATGARRSEVAGLDWRELNLNGAEWQLPAARSKNGKPHLKPLSELAIEVLHQLPV
jgi:integrase